MLPCRAALLLLDLQRDFLAGDGRMPVAQGQVAGLLCAVNRLAESSREIGWPVIRIRNEFSPWDFPANLFRRNAAIRGRPGAEDDPRVVVAADHRFCKSRADAFSNPQMEAFLRSAKADTVVIAGVFAEGCVSATAKGARRAGFRPVVVADAVAGANDRKVETALERLRRTGISVVTACSVMDESAF